jgi:hypothetical protein
LRPSGAAQTPAFGSVRSCCAAVGNPVVKITAKHHHAELAPTPTAAAAAATAVIVNYLIQPR